MLQKRQPVQQFLASTAWKEDYSNIPDVIHHIFWGPAGAMPTLARFIAHVLLGSCGYDAVISGISFPGVNTFSSPRVFISATSQAFFFLAVVSNTRTPQNESITQDRRPRSAGGRRNQKERPEDVPTPRAGHTTATPASRRHTRNVNLKTCRGSASSWQKLLMTRGRAAQDPEGASEEVPLFTLVGKACA